MTTELKNEHWQYLHNPPNTNALFKQQEADFRVTEQLGYKPCGSGEHIYLWTRKQGLNTAYVAEQLAKYAGLPLRAVTYAGRKDKYALTEQFFGVHLPGKKDIDWHNMSLPGFSILEATRHDKKLRTGNLKGNRFDITLRQVQQSDELNQRLQSISEHGVPNYFGEQRFGVIRQSESGMGEQVAAIGGNLALAQKMLSGETIRNRNKRSMAISALRSWLFNQYVSARLSAGKWQQILPGDAMQLVGSNSFFIAAENDDALKERLISQDIQITAPIWGSGDLPTTALAKQYEQAIADEYHDVCECLAALGLKQERRAISLYPQDMDWQFENDTLRLQFSLPAGAFATSVLREIVNVTGADNGGE
ncbi:tRNA pseudouridine(13) synthase TruD [Aestuariibacter salexigens]|uniref:tRNA pseudouridine(13) synthase TruD n=1 Tax=Aestuariibacter salexigens TaxID=226010 RepID=UPI0004065D07|nr:tRNA pseudouridine(13) synthase TruD [Aestuariibacter salexigens]